MKREGGMRSIGVGGSHMSQGQVKKRAGRHGSRKWDFEGLASAWASAGERGGPDTDALALTGVTNQCVTV